MPIIQGRNLKLVRMTMWLDQVKKNLQKVEQNLELSPLNESVSKLEDQYRNLGVLRDVTANDSILLGWKIVSDSE